MMLVTLKSYPAATRTRALGFALTALSLCASLPTRAATLASDVLIMPLAPEMSSSKQIPMPEGFDPKQPTWIAYQVYALSPTDTPEGKIVITGMFEREPTSPSASTVLFEPRHLRITESAGTIDDQFEAQFGKREEQELRATWGDDMYEAYAAVNAGKGRMLDGIANRELPPLSQGDPILLVSVERAEGIQPAGLMVTVGQGEIPAHLQPNVESMGAFKLGFGLGRIVFFGVLLAGLYWLFIGRRRNA